MGYPGYQRFFSRAAEIFGADRRPTTNGWHLSGMIRIRNRVIGVNISEFLIKGN